MFIKLSLLIACAYLSTCEAAFVDTLKKCQLKDSSCLVDLVQNLIKDISDTGIAEYNIPQLDPIVLKDVNVPVLNLVNITMVEGDIKGFKGCIIERAEVEIEKGKAVIGLTCDILVKGKHKVTGSSSILESTFGNEPLHGEGNFDLSLSKLHLTLHFYIDVIKKEDGEIYFKTNRDEFKYNFDVEGVHIDIDNLFLAEKDASKMFADYINENWKFIIQSFGGSFFDVLMNIVNDFIGNFFDNTPTKYYTSDDLTNLVQ